MKTHVCLISDQLVPNVLPALVERPDRIVLLTSPQMTRQAQRLQDFLERRGFSCERVPIQAYGFADVLAACADVIARHDGDELVLNVTGGTKIAALAAYQQFYFASKRIIYTDTDNECIQVLGDEPRDIPLADNLLNVKDYLACYGKRVIAERPRGDAGAARRRTLTQKLCTLFVADGELLRRWNALLVASDDEKPPFLRSIAGLGEPGRRLFDLLVAHGAAAPARTHEEFSIPTEELRFYLHGGWLEEYVYHTLLDMGVPGRACSLNVGIEWDASGAKAPTRNELDVLFTHRNRLHVISCKTAELGRGAAEPPKGKEALYELDSLTTAVGGLFARSMLVSARPLTPAAIQRAKDSGIEVVEGGAVLNLKDRLSARWGLGT